MIIGIDEAGRGSWAGPLTAAAVILPSNVDGLRDSKKLGALQRSALFATLQEHALIGVGWASPEYIDRHGLTAAQTKVMADALAQIDNPQVAQIIIDGRQNFLAGDERTAALVNADASHPQVMAASIAAKHLRDSYMVAMALVYPQYQLDLHKGYGTALHRACLEVHRPLKGLHRFSYRPIQGLLG